MSTTPTTDFLRQSGNWNPDWNEFAEFDPVWSEKFMEMGMQTLRSGALDRKTIEFLFIAVNASCTHMYAPGVRTHIRKALELGATREEIMAVLQVVSVIGIHSCSLGAPILKEELAARETTATSKAP
jgi:alkylhydroperoxidase/carboxymuconolactone decarboxylase family protein YurZ